MISAWRRAFKVADAYFGFVQLSTWCLESNILGIPAMRGQVYAGKPGDNEGQMAALKLPNVGCAHYIYTAH
jgi:hypothetical protein